MPFTKVTRLTKKAEQFWPDLGNRKLWKKHAELRTRCTMLPNRINLLYYIFLKTSEMQIYGKYFLGFLGSIQLHQFFYISKNL